MNVMLAVMVLLTSAYEMTKKPYYINYENDKASSDFTVFVKSHYNMITNITINSDCRLRDQTFEFSIAMIR